MKNNKVIIEQNSNTFYVNGIMFDSSDLISDTMKNIVYLLEELNIDVEINEV